MIPNAPRPFDFDLGDSAEMIRESARTFCDKEIAPRAAAIDRDNLFPRDLWTKMGALGLHGITAPEEYGGPQASAISSIAWRWRKRRAPPAARIRTSASTRSPATAIRRRMRAPAEAHLRRACSGN